MPPLSLVDHDLRAPHSKPRGIPITERSHGLLARLQAGLDALSARQEELSEAREQLLVDREDGIGIRKRIREQRLNTGDAEVALMNALREHYNRLELPLPEQLRVAYDKAEKEGLRLRAMEEEHLEAEEALGASEWDFIALENEFYQYHVQQLLSDENDQSKDDQQDDTTKITKTAIRSITASPDIQYHVVATRYQNINRRFEALRYRQSVRLDTLINPEEDLHQHFETTELNLEVAELADELLSLIVDCETQMRNLRWDLKHPEHTVMQSRRTTSEPDPDHPGWKYRTEAASDAHSEGYIRVIGDLPLAQERMHDWSLQSLKSSALDRLQFLNMLRPQLQNHKHAKLQFYHWEHHVSDVWKPDGSHSLTWPSHESPSRRIDVVEGSHHSIDDSIECISEVSKFNNEAEIIESGQDKQRSESKGMLLTESWPYSSTSHAKMPASNTTEDHGSTVKLHAEMPPKRGHDTLQSRSVEDLIRSSTGSADAQHMTRCDSGFGSEKGGPRLLDSHLWNACAQRAKGWIIDEDEEGIAGELDVISSDIPRTNSNLEPELQVHGTLVTDTQHHDICASENWKEPVDGLVVVQPKPESAQRACHITCDDERTCVSDTQGPPEHNNKPESTVTLCGSKPVHARFISTTNGGPDGTSSIIVQTPFDIPAMFVSKNTVNQFNFIFPDPNHWCVTWLRQQLCIDYLHDEHASSPKSCNPFFLTITQKLIAHGANGRYEGEQEETLPDWFIFVCGLLGFNNGAVVSLQRNLLPNKH
ncbi:hypothetical protein FB567DRAFT_518753 [Paraphoma chrysanthemicola]|uniref:Uncharacterized protein n=1 Tax=Paraphoma chrysanthemicola TaxID=798071 RepID=A0A8K0RCN3_9PLEO|nr:hypothetical protein FB567DRAFT_518753 [Paraphoma chrysanthemicola]